MLIGKVKIRAHEKGLLFKDKEFKNVLHPGRYWFFNPFGKVKVDVSSIRDPWLVHSDLDLIINSGTLEGHAEVIDLKDHERALVWVDNRFRKLLTPGQYALWKGAKDVRVEVVDARKIRFVHNEMQAIIRSEEAESEFNIALVDEGYVAVFFLDGKYVETVKPGRHVFWKNIGKVRVVHVDLREALLDVSGQEIMTSDKVTLRMNSVITYKVIDTQKAVLGVEDYRQSLYKEAQLALRAAVGAIELDSLLVDKDSLALELRTMLAGRVKEFGVEIINLGIKDVILPGEMKDLMNRVIESRKAAEANLIARREETAAMRSQANTAKLLENNPTLMRLRELEVLEKVAGSSKLNVVLGEKGLAEKVMQLI